MKNLNERTQVNYYAVTEYYSRRLKGYEEAVKVKEAGVYKFGVDKRELIELDLPCEVYEEHITKTYKKF